jgi:hypothetical protein
MKRKLILSLLYFLITCGLVLIIPRLLIAQETLIAHHMMHGGMRNGEVMNGDMAIIHQLFADRNQIHRTVEEIPGGMRSLTESDNRQVAALIKQHVASMYKRLEDGREFSMMNMSRTIPIMFRNADRYQRQFAQTATGLVVTETSKNSDMTNLIREHAREVDRFIAEGMPGMGGNMMMR